MPNIVYDVKLDFKDVLLRPKRSTLKSRSDVSVSFRFSLRRISQFNLLKMHTEKQIRR